MAISDITTREPILKAITEFDDLGRDAFLRKYGFREARSYYLRYDGKLYDSKAIVGVAHKHVQPNGSPLPPREFSGGDATVRRKLDELGFDVVVAEGGAEIPHGPELLVSGRVYSRGELREIFDITDATINTGVFRPKGHASIWLFVTEEKTADRTQYKDLLEGDVLYCSAERRSTI
jgi:hypothetical protein